MHRYVLLHNACMTDIYRQQFYMLTLLQIYILLLGLVWESCVFTMCVWLVVLLACMHHFQPLYASFGK